MSTTMKISLISLFLLYVSQTSTQYTLTASLVIPYEKPVEIPWSTISKKSVKVKTLAGGCVGIFMGICAGTILDNRMLGLLLAFYGAPIGILFGYLDARNNIPEILLGKGLTKYREALKPLSRYNLADLSNEQKRQELAVALRQQESPNVLFELRHNLKKIQTFFYKAAESVACNEDDREIEPLYNEAVANGKNIHQLLDVIERAITSIQ